MEVLCMMRVGVRFQERLVTMRCECIQLAQMTKLVMCDWAVHQTENSANGAWCMQQDQCKPKLQNAKQSNLMHCAHDKDVFERRCRMGGFRRRQRENWRLAQVNACI
jgi:hypothetical protein